MHFKNVTVKMVILVLGIVFCTFLPGIEAKAAVSPEQQYAFFKEQYPTVKELAEEYNTSWELAMAIGCHESFYGTSEFARDYNNLTGYDCYPENGEVVCHSRGHFSSERECWETYFHLVSDVYGKRGVYVNQPIELAKAIESKYCEVGYSERIANIYYGNVKPLIARYEADEQIQLQNKMAELAQEKLFEVKSVKPCKDGKVAGAIAAMYPRIKISKEEITVEKAAQKKIKGKYKDAQMALGEHYDDVMTYVEYITLPMQG